MFLNCSGENCSTPGRRINTVLKLTDMYGSTQLPWPAQALGMPAVAAQLTLEVSNKEHLCTQLNTSASETNL